MTRVLTSIKRGGASHPRVGSLFRDCALQRGVRDSVAGCAVILALTMAGIAPAAPVAPTPLGGPLHWPLAGADRALRGGLGDARNGRFHAGLDLSTARRNGAGVAAPADGWVERVRTSGVGYGRSLYIRTEDGRLVVFGHLDAFEPRLAAWVDSVQRATVTYEQDLWPPVGRFRYRGGERVAWSGESGAGPPHLHVEVRHGDFALNPLLAGYAVPDAVAPRIASVTLEPLDESSWVERSAAPRTHRFAASADTLVVEGRVRLTVLASDDTDAATGLPVHTTGARWQGEWVECRMDSLSWAGEMSQSEWLLDDGRVAGTGGVVIDAPVGPVAPRFLVSSRGETRGWSLLQVAAGDPARVLELFARDAAGNLATRRVWVRGPRPSERGPDTSPAKTAVAAKARPADPRWSFASLPDLRVRVRVAGVPAGLRDVRFERAGPAADLGAPVRASRDGADWVAILHANGLPDTEGLWVKGTLPNGRAWWHRASWGLWPIGSAMVARLDDGATLASPPGSEWEAGVMLVRGVTTTGLTSGATAVRAALEALPVQPPLRRAVTVTLPVPSGASRDHVVMMRRDGEGERWEWVESRLDSAAGTFTGESARLGQFALVRDGEPPVVVPLAVRAPVRGAYSTWALEARVTENVSGIAVRRCALRVDGVPVPVEWDAEHKVLRWRPLVPPAAGRHTAEFEAVDRAGHRTVRRTTFVVVSR